MNPTQKLAVLREQLDDLNLSWARLESRMLEAEKAICWTTGMLLVQTALCAVAIYSAMRG